MYFKLVGRVNYKYLREFRGAVSHHNVGFSQLRAVKLRLTVFRCENLMTMVFDTNQCGNKVVYVSKYAPLDSVFVFSCTKTLTLHGSTADLGLHANLIIGPIGVIV